MYTYDFREVVVASELKGVWREVALEPARCDFTEEQSAVERDQSMCEQEGA